MGYLKKVALQRQRNRDIEERHKEQKAKAAKAHQSAFLRPAPKPLVPGEESLLRKALKAMDPRLWKSKKTLAHEAEVERKRLEQEAKEKETKK